MNFKKLIHTPEYDFLWKNKHLGENLILLSVAGSYAYGTNNEFSDYDIRGIAVNRKSDLIGLSSYDQYVDHNTDTTIYTFNKIIKLLMDCNPNTCEMLGLREEHYLYLSPIGQELLDHKNLFLSKRAIHSFGGYAGQQLRRLQNALARDTMPQAEKEQHILRSVENSMYNFQERYAHFANGSLHIYLDKAVNPEFEQEIFMDTHLNHYPLRDYRNIWCEMNNVVKEYDKIGKRNHKKDENHLNKHAMHLLRLFMIAIDILEKEEICTYREKEHDLLMSVRNGAFQREDGMYRDEFYEILSGYEKRLEEAAKNTSLPDEPDKQKIEDFVMSVNQRVIIGI